MTGPFYSPPRPGGSTPADDTTIVLVWPDNARTIAIYLLVLGMWSIAGWWSMRGDACFVCGRDKGVCKHTRDSYTGGD